MGLFGLFRKRTTRGTPALAPMVQACIKSPAPAALQRCYEKLLGAEVLVMINQRVPGLPNGALLTPRSGVRVEFVTAVYPVTGARIVPVFSDATTLMTHFTPHPETQRDTIPYIGMRGRDLLAVVGGHGIALYAAKEAFYISADTIHTLLHRHKGRG